MATGQLSQSRPVSRCGARLGIIQWFLHHRTVSQAGLLQEPPPPAPYVPFGRCQLARAPTDGTSDPLGGPYGTLRHMASRSADRPTSKRRSMTERVGTWGNNHKSSRKNIPRAKARIQRSHRRAVQQELDQGVAAEPEALRRTSWRKWGSPTRAEHIESVLSRRALVQSEPVQTPEARDRRKARRGKA